MSIRRRSFFSLSRTGTLPVPRATRHGCLRACESAVMVSCKMRKDNSAKTAPSHLQGCESHLAANGRGWQCGAGRHACRAADARGGVYQHEPIARRALAVPAAVRQRPLSPYPPQTTAMWPDIPNFSDISSFFPRWPHSHCVVLEPYQSKYHFVTDLGLDRIFVYKVCFPGATSDVSGYIPILQMLDIYFPKKGQETAISAAYTARPTAQ